MTYMITIGSLDGKTSYMSRVEASSDDAAVQKARRMARARFGKQSWYECSRVMGGLVGRSRNYHTVKRWEMPCDS